MTIGSFINDVASLAGVAGLSWAEQLQPASWKGVPFAVTRSRARFGRRNAVHEYPFRDAPWVEDLGRGNRLIHIVGFLVGDDVIAQSKRMVAVCEQKDDDTGGELVHPIFGRERFALLDFEIHHDTAGRLAVLDFTFIGSSPRIYPTATVATVSQSLVDADLLDTVAGASFAERAAEALRQGGAVVRSVVETVQKYGGTVFRLVADATSLSRTVQGLPGTFGRFFDGAKAAVFGIGASITPPKPATTVPQLIARGAAARATATAAMNAAQTSAASLSPSTAADFGARPQAVMAALAAATSDPADQIRIFSRLATFDPVVAGDTAMVIAQTACVDLWRRAALAALARASAAYQPSSYDEAAAIRTRVCDLLDVEIAVAGDQGEDDVFLALGSLRASVARDLTRRGADLAPIVTVSTTQPLPAPVIAMRLYQDPARTDELIAESNARHPAFMPTSFRVLAR